jgi:hypothetical protein
VGDGRGCTFLGAGDHSIINAYHSITSTCRFITNARIDSGGASAGTRAGGGGRREGMGEQQHARLPLPW